MKDNIIEIRVALGHSSRTQWLLAVGVVFAMGTWLLGELWIDNIQLEGTTAPMTDAIQTLLRDRYGGVALGILVTTA